MANISLVHLDANQLSSHLPPELAKLPLVVLNASNNHFSGAIPSELGGIQCIQSLDLSQNNFSGELPTSLNKLSELNKFNVSYNPLLSGVIPSSGQLSTFDNDSFLGDPLITFNSSTSIASVAPLPTSNHRASGAGRWREMAFFVFIALATIFLAVSILSFVLCLWIRNPVDQEPDGLLSDSGKRRSDVAAPSSSKSASSSSTPSDGVKVFRLDKTAFTYKDIVAATGNFSNEMVIGRGGYSVVYRGVLPDRRDVAVKKLELKREEEQEGGDREFRAEMEVMAGRTGFGSGHPNLVALYGWCLYGSAKILVYEYMEGGSLEEVVGDWARFGWERRLETAIGVARALVFLHHECKPAVVHRDVKASNVLLDRWGRARVTDFGLARMVRPGESHVSTVVAGTVGYVAPEYGQTWHATTRGDVYSYGVLVMELATGRRAVDGGEECLLDQVRRAAAEGRSAMRETVGATDLEGVEKMCGLLRVALKCTSEVPQARPDMKEVLHKLLRMYEENDEGGDSSPPF